MAGAFGLPWFEFLALKGDNAAFSQPNFTYINYAAAKIFGGIAWAVIFTVVLLSTRQFRVKEEYTIPDKNMMQEEDIAWLAAKEIQKGIENDNSGKEAPIKEIELIDNQNNITSVEGRLVKLNELYKKGLIEKELYLKRKDAILNDI